LYVVFSQLCTIYYFLHFLVILPVVGLLETPRPLPSSISEDVLAKKKPALPEGKAMPAE
jgi:ubiquinol-cytochrome c reductase cytochrome b subunit